MLVKNQWEVKNYDLNPDHEDFELSRPYFFWVEFMRLSPTIELVHKKIFTKEGLNESEERLCPEDFDDVISTYLSFNLEPILYKKMSFVKWWETHGRDVFYLPINRCKVQSAGLISPRAGYGKIDLERIENKLRDIVKSEPYTFHAILSVPLSGDRTKILNQIEELLTKDVFTEAYIPQKRNVIFHRLSGQRIHIQPMEKTLRLIYLKANEPDISNWRLGVKAGLSNRYSYLDSEATKLAAKDADARHQLGIITIRMLKKSLRMIENAARGKFPCDDPVPLANIDFGSIGNKVEQLKELNRRYPKHRPK